MKKARLTSLLLALCWLLCSACRPLFPLPASRVGLISNQIPPNFEFRGRLNLEYIQFVGPYSVDRQKFLTPDSNDSDRTVVWRIDPPNFHDIPVNDSPRITYGQLPTGWKQEIPQAGPAPPLVDGAVYYVSANLNEGRRIVMCFLVRDGKAQVYNGKIDHLDCNKE